MDGLIKKGAGQWERPQADGRARCLPEGEAAREVSAPCRLGVGWGGVQAPGWGERGGERARGRHAGQRRKPCHLVQRWLVPSRPVSSMPHAPSLPPSASFLLVFSNCFSCPC